MIDLEGVKIQPEEREWLKSSVVGGVILFRRNFENLKQVTNLISEIHQVRSPPLLVAVDQEGGRVQRFCEPFTILPPMRSLGHLYDQDPARALIAAKSFGGIMAAELRSVGVDLSFTPVVDLDLGLASVIGDRALHSQSVIVGALAAEFSKGTRKAGMAVVAKHFPTHAGVLNDTHTDGAIDSRKYSELWDDLHPYRHLISFGLEGVMVGHVSFSEVDPLPASFSSWWIEKELRGQLGFKGVVFSDDVGMQGAASGGTCSERMVKSLEAGCDMVLVCNKKNEISSVIKAANACISPASQVRLMRMRGKKDTNWDELHGSDYWKKIRDEIDLLHTTPELELKG